MYLVTSNFSSSVEWHNYVWSTTYRYYLTNLVEWTKEMMLLPLRVSSRTLLRHIWNRCDLYSWWPIKTKLKTSTLNTWLTLIEKTWMNLRLVLDSDILKNSVVVKQLLVITRKTEVWPYMLPAHSQNKTLVLTKRFLFSDKIKKVREAFYQEMWRWPMFACSISLTFFLIKSFRSFKVAEFMTATSANKEQT